MNTYGRTACPVCKELNTMYRPIEICRKMPAWDEVNCFNCTHYYLHSNEYYEPELYKRESIKPKTERDQVITEGKF